MDPLATIERMFVCSHVDSPGAPLQGSLLGMGEPQVPETVGNLQRRSLENGAWLDHRPGWLPGADAWFDLLLGGLDWRTARRPMFDKIVDVPRLIWARDLHDGECGIVASLDHLAHRLADHYRRPLPGLHANLYRDGSDSVAWHRDKVANPSDALVAIVSLGAARSFAVRPVGGGTAIRFDLGRGDLLVMGGTMQCEYEHAVPKTKHGSPRISVMIRSDDGTAPSAQATGGSNV